MRILIVEDQEEKGADIISFFECCYGDSFSYSIKNSLRSGLKELLFSNKYNLIVLDMSMPNFDPSSDDPIGGTPESFAGKEFLSQMDLRNIEVPVAIVTQYATFAKGQIALEELDLFLKKSYPNFYLGAVYYSSAENAWKNRLKEIIKEIVL